MLAGAPDQDNGYQHHHIHGFEIYVNDELRVGPRGIKIGLGGWGPFRFISLEGAA